MLTTRPNYAVRTLIHKRMMNDMASSKTCQQRQAFLFFLEALLPQISVAHFNQVYLEKFLEFKDETISQMVIQYVRLFPLARMRVSNQRQADRLELILKSLYTRYSKMTRVSYIMSEINDTLIKIRSSSFQQKVMNFL